MSQNAPPPRHRCVACREAHTACDRKQPCSRCVRIGRADACQQPQVLRKRGRPRNPTSVAPLQPQATPLVPASASEQERSPPPASLPRVEDDEEDIEPARSDEELCTQIERSLEDSLEESQGLGQLLVLLMDELREVKRHNREIGDTVETLKRKKDQLDSQLEMMHHTQRTQLKQLAQAQKRSMQQMQAVIAQMGSGRGAPHLQDGPTAHGPVPPPPLPLPPSLGLPPAPDLGTPAAMRNVFPSSVLRLLPFLPSYDFSKEGCIVEDLGQMTLVARINEPRSFDELEPATIFYASPSLSSLLGFQPGELAGRSSSQVCEGTFDVMVGVLAQLLSVSPTPVGRAFVIEGRFIAKEPGQSVSARSRHQILYSPSGTSQWLLAVVDEILPHDPNLLPPVPYGHFLTDPHTRRSLRAAVDARLGVSSDSSSY